MLLREDDPDVTCMDWFMVNLMPCLIPGLYKGTWSDDDLRKLREDIRKLEESGYKKSAKKWTIERGPQLIVHATDAPMVCWVHGGGFVVGQAEDGAGARIIDELNALRRISWASVEYRRAPEHKYPLAVDDVVAALKWLADRYPRLSLAGVSAGATLALEAALQSDVKLDSLALFYPFLDPDMKTKSYAKHGPRLHMDKFYARCWTAYLDGATEKYELLAKCSDSKLVAKLPSTLVVTARADELHDEGLALVAALKEAGARNVTSIDCRGGHVYAHNADGKAGKRVMPTWAALIGQQQP